MLNSCCTADRLLIFAPTLTSLPLPVRPSVCGAPQGGSGQIRSRRSDPVSLCQSCLLVSPTHSLSCCRVWINAFPVVTCLSSKLVCTGWLFFRDANFKSKFLISKHVRYKESHHMYSLFITDPCAFVKYDATTRH